MISTSVVVFLMIPEYMLRLLVLLLDSFAFLDFIIKTDLSLRVSKLFLPFIQQTLVLSNNISKLFLSFLESIFVFHGSSSSKLLFSFLKSFFVFNWVGGSKLFYSFFFDLSLISLIPFRLL